MIATVNELCAVVSDAHHCTALHFDSVSLVERTGETILWEGIVHVFNLLEHPETHRCYAWVFTGERGENRCLTVLHLPPVNSAHTALRAAIASGQQK
jgi:hypothetical protein